MRMLFLILVGCVAVTAQTGQISITVVGTSGVAIKGANVTVAARPFYDAVTKKLGPLYNTTGITGTNGNLLINVPPGAYAVCAQLAASDYLDSCSWVAKTKAVLVKPGVDVAVTLALSKGVVFTVNLNDGSGLLAKVEKFPGEQMHVGLQYPDGHWLPMKILNPNPYLRQCSALVPPDMDLKLILKSERFHLTDSTGADLDTITPGNSVSVKVSTNGLTLAAVPSGIAAQFNVIGLR